MRGRTRSAPSRCADQAAAAASCWRHVTRSGRWILASSLALFAGELGATPRAHAATYTVLICSASPHVGPGPFTRGGAVGRFKIESGCRDGGALRVADDGVQNAGRTGAWQIEERAAEELIPQRLAFRARGHADKGLRPEIEGLRRGSGWVRLAGGSSLPARRFATVKSTGPFAAMRLRLRCVRAGGCPRGDAHVHVKKVRFVVQDPTPPGFPRPSGQLVQQPVQRDMQVLGSEQRDGESGIALVNVLVNGRQVSTLPGSCMGAGRAASGRISRGAWRPCRNTTTGTPIQTNDGIGPWREGFNQLRLCAADFAGNSSCSQQRTLRVDNLCPIRPQGDTAQTPTALRLTFPDGSRGKTVRHPRTPKLRASLRSATGAELPTGSPSICIGETLRLAKTPHIRTLTPTIPAGGALGIAPRASRFFYANYWLDEQRVLSSRARLRMRARPRFEIRPKRARVGRRVRFITRLHGPRAARKRVTLQVKQGRRWRLFRTGRTNRKGVHRRTYRFRTVVGKVRFRFRAVAPRQRGYPYGRGASKSRSIVVSG